MNGFSNVFIWNSKGSSGQPPPPTPTPVVTRGSTTGGIERYTIQFPRPPREKELPKFKRNTENQDRKDIEDIVRILMKAGIIN